MLCHPQTLVVVLLRNEIFFKKGHPPKKQNKTKCDLSNVAVLLTQHMNKHNTQDGHSRIAAVRCCGDRQVRARRRVRGQARRNRRLCLAAHGRARLCLWTGSRYRSHFAWMFDYCQLLLVDLRCLFVCLFVPPRAQVCQRPSTSTSSWTASTCWCVPVARTFTTALCSFYFDLPRARALVDLL